MRRWAPVLASACIGLVFVGRWALWGDEIFTWGVVQRSPLEMIAAAAGDRHPPLYYLLAAPFTLFGDLDAILRLPSLVAVVTSVALLRQGVGRYVDEETGEIAAWIVALSPFATVFGVTARMYAVLLMMGTGVFVSTLALVRGDRPDRAAALAGLAAAGAIWTHYAGISAVLGGGVAATLGLLGSPLPRRERMRRFGMLVLAFGIAGLTFVPWALGPLRFQLANKDAPSARTLFALRYALWSPDERIPWLSMALAASQVGGIALAARRRDGWLLGWAVVGVVAPWVLSSSGPAQNPRNHIVFLPAAAVLISGAYGAVRRWLRPSVVIAAYGGLLVSSYWHIYDRTTSPQERSLGFDRRVESQVLDASIPVNAGLHFRPSYVLNQYRRYAPALADRNALPLDTNAWLGISRAEWLDPSVTARFSRECTFETGFRLAFYAPDGPGCQAVQWWMPVVAEALDYVPFEQELAVRELEAGNLALAEKWAIMAAAGVRGHPSPALTLARIRLREEDGDGALEAAKTALAVAIEYGFGGPTMAEAWGIEASAYQLLGEGEAGANALRQVECARKLTFPQWCGRWLEGFSPEIPESDRYKQDKPLPALTESQLAAVPEDPPKGSERRAVWPFDGTSLPEGWSDLVGTDDAPSASVTEVEGGSALVVANTATQESAVVCGPATDAVGRVAIRLRWRVEHSEGDGRTGAYLEVRMLDAEGHPLRVAGNPVMERALTTTRAVPWRVDRFDVRTANDAEKVRVCLRVDGSVPARWSVDWMDVSVVSGP